MRYIGVFDSGLGGLTVVRSILARRPDINIVFFGDTLNMPYGDKTKAEITELALHDARVLEQYDPAAIVIACNTADSAGGAKVKAASSVPVYGVIEVTARAAAAATQNRKIGVIATRATIRSRAYPKAIRKILPEAEVYTRACPELVPLIEAGHLQKDDPEIVRILNRYLPALVRKGIDTLVLGCTHYPLIMDTVTRLCPDLTLISSSDAQAEAVLANLPAGEEFTGGHQLYLVSSDPAFFAEKARVFMPDAKKIELYTE
ncbi:MAG: glutamate racemase [Solobacterium sp.]|nr:glutamate racemase [Solobacterium sp.]